jgi:hypothetical protein
MGSGRSVGPHAAVAGRRRATPSFPNAATVGRQPSPDRLRSWRRGGRYYSNTRWWTKETWVVGLWRRNGNIERTKYIST